jgi:cellulose synthase/poly-beta-1,6-N-acetylglucosamine synthase-like glycosyltransferase
MSFLSNGAFDAATILLIVFACLSLVMAIFIVVVFGKLAFYKNSPRLVDINLPPLTVIIAARNESDNLFENLPFILEQDYPLFEVIVINNQSIDDSSYLLTAYSNQYPHLRVIEVAKNPHLKPGKKLPITLGVKGAKFEHLVLTDADCKPASDKWLRSMSSCFVPGKELVIGYGPLKKTQGFLNKLVRFDTAWIATNYFSFALAKLPYMGVGRNLAYTKKLFNEAHGFRSHYSIPSGDDDLFVQEAAKNKNYCINIDEQSFCYSEGHSQWSNWMRQKSRHYSVVEKYKVIKKAMLGIYPLLALSTLLCFVILMFNSELRWLALAIFAFITILKWWIMGRCFAKLKEKSFIPYLPLWDFLYIFLLPTMFYATQKKKADQW